MARALHPSPYMNLSRHAEMENLTYLLNVRRRQALARCQSKQGYLDLLSAVLDAPSSELAARLPRANAVEPIKRIGSHEVRAA